MNKEREFNFESTFPPLGHPEHHFNKYPDHPWLKTKEEIMNWLESNDSLFYAYGKDNVIIYDDLTVEVEEACLSFKLSDNASAEEFENYEYIKLIPIQIRKCKSLDISHNELESLIGTPYVCESLDVVDNNLESFEGLGFYVSNLAAMHNSIKSVKELDEKYNFNLLSLEANPILDIDTLKANCQVLFWFQKSINEYNVNSVDQYLKMKKNIKKIIFNADFERELELALKVTKEKDLINNSIVDIKDNKRSRKL